MPGRTLRRTAAALFAAGVGIAAPYAVPDGVDDFRGPVERRVAAEALLLAEIACLDHPLAGLVTPRVRVRKVWLERGSCEVMRGASGLAGSDWRATVRAYGPFGVPLRSFAATCGGSAVLCV